MRLNITSGDYFNNYIKTKENGIFLPFNESILTGPVDINIFSSKFINLRSNYHGVSKDEYLNKLSDIVNPNYINTFDEINLWFGEDTFCVINLITILAYLEQIKYSGIIYYTRIDDYTNDIIKEKELIKLSIFNKVYETVILNKTFIQTDISFIDTTITNYLDLHNGIDNVSNYIKNNLNLDDNTLLINSLNNSKDLGLSDVIIQKLINKFKYEYYELYYNNELISNIKLNLGNNIMTYKIINKDDIILNFLNHDFIDSLDNVPFIKSRIDNMNKFNKTVIDYPTDNYSLKKVFKAIL